MSWQWNPHSGDDEIPSAPHSSPFDSSSAFNQMANDKAKEPDDTTVRVKEGAFVNQTPSIISKVRDDPLLLENESAIFGATICFTPERSLSPSHVDTAERGVIEGHSQASSNIAEMLAKSSPNSALPSLCGGLANLTNLADASLKIAKTTLPKNLQQPTQTKIPQAVSSMDPSHASAKSMVIAEDERHQDESRKMKDTSANKIQAMIRSWVSKRGTFRIKEQGKSNADNHEEAGMIKRSAIKGSNDINKSNSARSHRDTTKVRIATTACTLTLIVMLIFNCVSQGTFQVIEHADIDVEGGSSGQFSTEEEDDLHHRSTCHGFDFSRTLFELAKGGILSDQASEEAVPGYGVNLFVILTVILITILLFSLVFSQAKLFQHVSKLLARLDEKDSILSRITEEKIELIKKLATMQRLNDNLTLTEKLRAESLQATSAATAAELKATSDIAAAESTIASLRSDAVELRRENESLNEKLTESQLRVESEIQEVGAGLAQAAAASAAAETSIASLRSAIEELRRENESRHQEATDRIESEIQEARTNLIQATSAAAESTLASIRDDMEELRRENSSLQEQVMSRLDADIPESRVSLSQTTSAAAVAKSTVLSLRSELEELRTQNESLQVHLNESQGTNSEEQEEDEVTVPPISSIGFEDVTTSTNKSVKIPNGYRGLNWENAHVMHRSYWPRSGYEHGIVSGNYVAYNRSGNPCSISSTTPFSVAGFQATAAYRTGLNVLVESFDVGGNRIGRYATTLGDPQGGPTFIDLRREGNFEELYKLKITASGGIDTGLGGIGYDLAIDDLRVY